MKSRSKSSLKPRKKLKLLQGLIYSSLKERCDLSLQRLNYNSTEKKTILKNDKAQKSKLVFGNKYFQKS